MKDLKNKIKKEQENKERTIFASPEFGRSDHFTLPLDLGGERLLEKVRKGEKKKKKEKRRKKKKRKRTRKRVEKKRKKDPSRAIFCAGRRMQASVQ